MKYSLFDFILLVIAFLGARYLFDEWIMIFFSTICLGGMLFALRDWFKEGFTLRRFRRKKNS